MNRVKYEMAATDTDLYVNASPSTSTAGWLGVVEIGFDGAYVGDVSIRVKPNLDNKYYPVGGVTLSSEGTAIWTGNAVLRDGDVLNITKNTSNAASVYITYTYEAWGAGTWQTFDAGEFEESTSSSSDSSSSESSNSSSSKSESSNSSSSKSLSTDSSSSSSSVLG